MQLPDLKVMECAFSDGVLELTLNRPEKSNALDGALWQALRQAFDWADANPPVRVVILSGAGRHFCAGIDLAMLGGLMQSIAASDEARSREALRRLILDLQDCLSSIERCRKPVLAAIHGACLGGGLDLVACCDMRYLAVGAEFAIREIDLGMVADVGSLQRLPRLLSPGLVRELAFTGRTLDADAAVRCGLANAIYPDRESLLNGVRQLARQIAAKSPLAIRGSKAMLNYARDHSLADSLDYAATWNASVLLSSDLHEAMQASQARRRPVFPD